MYCVQRTYYILRNNHVYLSCFEEQSRARVCVCVSVFRTCFNTANDAEDVVWGICRPRRVSCACFRVARNSCVSVAAGTLCTLFDFYTNINRRYLDGRDDRIIHIVCHTTYTYEQRCVEYVIMVSN